MRAPEVLAGGRVGDDQLAVAALEEEVERPEQPHAVRGGRRPSSASQVVGEHVEPPPVDLDRDDVLGPARLDLLDRAVDVPAPPAWVGAGPRRRSTRPNRVEVRSGTRFAAPAPAARSGAGTGGEVPGSSSRPACSAGEPEGLLVGVRRLARLGTSAGTGSSSRVGELTRHLALHDRLGGDVAHLAGDRGRARRAPGCPASFSGRAALKIRFAASASLHGATAAAHLAPPRTPSRRAVRRAASRRRPGRPPARSRRGSPAPSARRPARCPGRRGRGSRRRGWRPGRRSSCWARDPEPEHVVTGDLSSRMPLHGAAGRPPTATTYTARVTDSGGTPDQVARRGRAALVARAVMGMTCSSTGSTTTCAAACDLSLVGVRDPGPALRARGPPDADGPARRRARAQPQPGHAHRRADGAAGLVARGSSPEDGRGVVATLTDKGCDLLVRMAPVPRRAASATTSSTWSAPRTSPPSAG